jgi:hypothetical protein
MNHEGDRIRMEVNGAEWRHTTTTRRLVFWSPRARYVHFANQKSLIMQRMEVNATCNLI